MPRLPTKDSDQNNGPNSDQTDFAPRLPKVVKRERRLPTPEELQGMQELLLLNVTSLQIIVRPSDMPSIQVNDQLGQISEILFVQGNGLLIKGYDTQDTRPDISISSPDADINTGPVQLGGINIGNLQTGRVTHRTKTVSGLEQLKQMLAGEDVDPSEDDPAADGDGSQIEILVGSKDPSTPVVELLLPPGKRFKLQRGKETYSLQV